MTVLPGVMAERNFYIREAADTSTIESWSLTVPGVWNNTQEHELSGKEEGFYFFAGTGEASGLPGKRGGLQFVPGWKEKYG